jgi:hypothetical protein
MRRTNGQRHVPESAFTGAPGGAHSSAQPHESEQLPTAYLANELAEGELSNWEDAWIDLGGEG